MNPQEQFDRDDTVTEFRAMVDLVEANVSPVTEGAAWDAEIAARRQDGRVASAAASSAALQEVIDYSTSLA